MSPSQDLRQEKITRSIFIANTNESGFRNERIAPRTAAAAASTVVYRYKPVPYSSTHYPPPPPDYNDFDKNNQNSYGSMDFSNREYGHFSKSDRCSFTQTNNKNSTSSLFCSPVTNRERSLKSRDASDVHLDYNRRSARNLNSDRITSNNTHTAWDADDSSLSPLRASPTKQDSFSSRTRMSNTECLSPYTFSPSPHQDRSGGGDGDPYAMGYSQRLRLKNRLRQKSSSRSITKPEHGVEECEYNKSMPNISSFYIDESDARRDRFSERSGNHSRMPNLSTRSVTTKPEVYNSESRARFGAERGVASARLLHEDRQKLYTSTSLRSIQDPCKASPRMTNSSVGYRMEDGEKDWKVSSGSIIRKTEKYKHTTLRDLEISSPGATPIDTRTIEVTKGLSLPFRGASETRRAIRCGFYKPCVCVCCNRSLFCIQDADFVVCPDCKVVSTSCAPDDIPDTSGGVALGFH